jgi:hypothetical protein
LREARLLLITLLLQQLGVRVLVPLDRRRSGWLPEAWNDGRLLRLQAARRLKLEGLEDSGRIRSESSPSP